MPYLEFRGNSVPLILMKITMGFSRVSVGETGLLLRSEVKVGVPFESKQRNWHSSANEMCNTGIFSSCGTKLWVPLEL